MVKLSVIVPIYNVENYLKKCLDSIIHQTFTDIEIILVNDGSIDNSLSICREYESKDNRIKVFDTVNSGVSSARNLGIKHSKGEYITFVDPDDWIDNTMYEKMVTQINMSDADVCMCGYKDVSSDELIINENSITSEDKILVHETIRDDILPSLIGPKTLNAIDEPIMGSVWRLVIKKKVLVESNILFEKDIPLMEDLLFCIELLIKANKVILIKECFYNYRINNSNAMNKYRGNLKEINRVVMNKITSLINENLNLEHYKIFLENRYCTLLISQIINETKKSNPTTKINKIKRINNFCEDKELSKILNDLKLTDYPLKRKMLLLLLKYKMGTLIYLYYSLLNRKL